MMYPQRERVNEWFPIFGMSILFAQGTPKGFLFQDCGCSNCSTFICSLLLLQAEKAFNFLCTELTF